MSPVRASASLLFLSCVLASCSGDDAACSGAACDAGADSAVKPPDVSGGGCDSSLPVAQGGCAVTDEDGVFVSLSAALGGDGTKALPFRTIQAGVDAAKNGKPNVYVCAGTYDEHVTVAMNAAGVALHGGFACDTWAAGNAKTAIAPSTKGLALRVDASPAVVEGFALSATDGDAMTPGDSSVVALINGAAGMTFRRASIAAGKGSAGATGTTDTTDPGMAANGNDATGPITPGAMLVCKCDNGGGTGGAGGWVSTPGMAGAPVYGGPPVSTPGMLGAPSCSAGGAGNAGGNGPDGAAGAGATSLGVLSAQGWAPAAGSPGTEGKIGGGGGGGGNTYAQGASGGGACGGCGGHGGGGGGGGGASIGVIALNSLVRLQSTTVTTQAAGDGGPGGMGQKGQTGGKGGKNMGGTACVGGDGGSGGAGGVGGGGAGGVSIGVAWVGMPPNVDPASAITPGAAGNGGGMGAVAGASAKDKSF